MTIAELQEHCTDPAQIRAGLRAYARWIEEDPTIDEVERTEIIVEIVAQLLMAGA